MLKNILKLKGAQKLTKNEQKSISGGRPLVCNYMGDTGQVCTTHSDCAGDGNPVCYRGCCNTLV